jgi:hypothetical protein
MKPKVHIIVHNDLPFVCILGQLNPVYILSNFINMPLLPICPFP